MSLIDVQKLLKEISADAPCGEDLEYDPIFGEMDRAAQGKPERQIGKTLKPAEPADWSSVKKKAISLFARTKDLRISVYLTRSLVSTHGLLGLCEGLTLVHGLLEQYWDDVHPKLDADENNDPTVRINVLSSLCDADAVLNGLRDAILVKSKVFGKISLRDIQVALGTASIPSGSTAQPLEISAVNGAFMEADLDELQAIFDATRLSIDKFKAIESLLMDKVGAQMMVDLSALPVLLKEAQKIMNEQLVQRGVGVEESADSNDGANGAGNAAQSQSPISGKINSREDAIRALDLVCDYFKQHEPSSPIPLLLQRAKRLVAKDFMEILRDLTPAGVTQAEDVTGTKK